MSKPFDYSKWDKIELSDDEDDVHPNIDRESWFRMKHRSRVEREENEAKDRKRIEDEVCHVLCRTRMRHPMCVFLLDTHVTLYSPLFLSFSIILG